MWEVSEWKRQRNKNLNPGNQCITGKVFLDAINFEKERKKEKKEEKKRKHARLAEEKKRKLEERKEKKKREKEAKAEKAAKKGEKSKKKSKSKKSKAAADRYQEELSVYSCTSCGVRHDPDIDDPWVECDYCGDWYHIQCTSLPVLDDLGDNVDFTCEMCVEEGFPSHECS